MDEKDDEIAHRSILARNGSAPGMPLNHQFAMDTLTWKMSPGEHCPSGMLKRKGGGHFVAWVARTVLLGSATKGKAGTAGFPRIMRFIHADTACSC
jgi:hypothetical protein